MCRAEELQEGVAGQGVELFGCSDSHRCLSAMQQQQSRGSALLSVFRCLNFRAEPTAEAAAGWGMGL